MMKRLAFIFISLLISAFAKAGGPDVTTMAGHPHVLVKSGEDFKKINEVVKTSEMLGTIEAYLFTNSDLYLNKAVERRVLKGRRLLNVSVECFTRIFFLTYSYRITGNEAYAQRAIKEMLAVAAFEDWNPAHFLDTAEMMCALGIGYDWLYHKMTAPEREIIRNAIIEKGLKPSLDEKYNAKWLNSKSNWNQVCNAGSTIAALAIIDTNPEYAELIVPRAVQTIQKPLAAYNPDGAYREGPGYWCYGTGYNCLFFAALEKYYGTDYALIEKYPVFLKTVDYHLAMMTPTYEVFCYADQAFPAQVSIAPFYLYDKTGDDSYLYMEQNLLRDVPLELARCRHQRLLPASLVFAGLSGRPMNNISKPVRNWYIGQGATPVAAFRSDWESTDALYIGLKCGCPGEGHNHMDEGSFYMEANGVRWALDLGGEVYYNLEKAGVDLWSYGKDAGRWRLLRTGLWGHNCLILNSHDLNVKGYCKIDESKTDDENDLWAKTDMSSIYDADAKAVSRKIALKDKHHFEIEDKVSTSGKAVNLRWQMASHAVSMKPAGKNCIRLTSKDGKTLLMKVEADIAVKFHEWSAEPFASYESKNPGVKFFGFTAGLKSNKDYTIKTILIPE